MVDEGAAVSAQNPDWSREKKVKRSWEPGKSLLASLRSYARWQHTRGPLGPLLRKQAVFRHRLWSAIAAADIPLGTRIDGGLLLPHPNGVVIHPRAVLGPNCLIFQQVTIGVFNGGRAPVIGGHVDIGAGAKILGEVRIGDHVKIGANAVVLSDVPAHATAVGVPARVLLRRGSASERHCETCDEQKV